MVGSTAYYLHQDALGSTRLVATSTVTIKFSSNYVPYGNNYGISGKEVFMYTGKPLDSATGLYYFGARYFDSSLGRFVTQDTKFGSTEDPQSLNLYTYCRDNPLKLVDPNGHDWWNPFTWTPAQQTTAVIVVGAVVGSVLCWACAPTLAGAAISAVTYTVTAGSNANVAGVIGAAVAGGVSVGVAAPVAGAIVGVVGTTAAPIVAGAASSFGGQFAGIGASVLLGGKPSVDPTQIIVNTVLGSAGPSIGSGLEDVLQTRLGFSAVGRPASSLTTLVSSVFDPAEHPRAAYQFYSGLAKTAGDTVTSLISQLF